MMVLPSLMNPAFDPVTVAPALAARRPRWVGYAVAAALVLGLGLGLVALGWATPVRAYLRVDALAAAGARVRDSPLALLWVLAAFVLASLVFVPITPLLAATALVFDPVVGLIDGLLAATLAAWVTHALGRVVGRWRGRWLQGPRAQAVAARARRQGLATVFIARVLPVGSFTLFNLVAGAMGIPLLPYLVGNALGLLPRMLAFALLADGVGRTLAQPRPGNLALLGVVVVGLLAGWAWLRRRAARALARTATRSAPPA